MSADMEIWNAGASHASVMRRAIVFRIWFSFTTSTSPLGARAPADGAALTAPDAEARSTSSATMRPSGPVPRRAESSIPRSRAMRRASGDALTRPPFVLSTLCSGSDGPSGASSRPRSRSSSRSGAGEPSSCASSSETSVGSSASPSGTSSPCSPMTAIALPTSISSPSPARILSRTPEASASTSCVTFSVSSS